MILLNERNQVKQAIKDFIESYSPGGWLCESPRRELALQKLSELDPDKASSADVAEIIGSAVWVQKKTCDECGKDSWDCVELGEEPAFSETRTAIVCKDCLKKALQLFGDE